MNEEAIRAAIVNTLGAYYNHDDRDYLNHGLEGIDEELRIRAQSIAATLMSDVRDPGRQSLLDVLEAIRSDPDQPLILAIENATVVAVRDPSEWEEFHRLVGYMIDEIRKYPSIPADL
jgi:hypothetical protein